MPTTRTAARKMHIMSHLTFACWWMCSLPAAENISFHPFKHPILWLQNPHFDRKGCNVQSPFKYQINPTKHKAQSSSLSVQALVTWEWKCKTWNNSMQQAASHPVCTLAFPPYTTPANCKYKWKRQRWIIHMNYLHAGSFFPLPSAARTSFLVTVK